MIASSLTSAPATTAALEVEGLSKTFGSARVLSEFSLQVMPGEVHALVGQNGSGKSTFIKILSGFQTPDPGGRVLVAGLDKAWWDRIAFVHQDLGFIDDATIVENLAGSSRRSPTARIDWRRERQRAREIIALAGLSLSADLPMRSLQPVDKALLAIARARRELGTRSDAVLVLDEPTAYLPNDRIEGLLAQVRESAAAGIAVVLVTHQLKEVMAAADRVTVLRDGVAVYTEQVARTSEDAIVEAMIGTKLDSVYPDRTELLREAPMLAVSDLHSDTIGPIDLEVRPGEVVGLTGLVASGWESLPYALMGATPGIKGCLSVDGGRMQSLATLNPRRARRLGLALLPADRVRDSAVGELSVEENLTVAALDRFCSGPKIDLAARRGRADELLGQFEVRPAACDVMMSTLSGGNQQKVLMAKWLEMQPRVLVLHEPTQGVDVGARRQILEHVMQAAANGAAVIIASAEHEDLVHMCHRVHVFHEGRIGRTLSGAELTVSRLLREVQGVEATASGDRSAASAPKTAAG